MSTEYTLNVHLGSGQVRHVVERDRLVITYDKTARTESIPFGDIREINLRQEMPGVYATYIRRHAGKTLMIPSRHFKSLGVFDDRHADYAQFARALLEASAKASPTTLLTAGSSALYVIGWILIVIGIVFSLAVLVASIARGLPPLRMLFVLPLAIFMGLGFVRQGRARAIDPASPPREVVPG